MFWGQSRLQNHQQAGDVAGKHIAVDSAFCWGMSEAAALVWDDIARWDNSSGCLTVRRSKTDTTPRTVYLTPLRWRTSMRSDLMKKDA